VEKDRITKTKCLEMVSFYSYPLITIVVSGSPEFEEFLAFLGDKIELRGWQKYRAGLDVKGK
jgi:hypothetical protein